MSVDKLEIQDYPLAENRRDLVRGRRGKTLDELDLEALKNGEVILDDLRITPQALELQAEIARTGNRPKLAENFERASELVEVPQDYLMEIYELLRPGRAPDKTALLEVAQNLRLNYQATRMAEFIEEAAEVYEARGLFASRF